jgi:ribosomal protein L7/L12
VSLALDAENTSAMAPQIKTNRRITESADSDLEFQVRLQGWRVGFQKISAVHTIRMHTKLRLAEAKRCVDDCLMGKQTVLHPPSDHDARKLATELHKLGAIVTLE